MLTIKNYDLQLSNHLKYSTIDYKDPFLVLSRQRNHNLDKNKRLQHLHLVPSAQQLPLNLRQQLQSIMSASAMSPTSPIAQRDMRSAAKPSKRDKDHGAKWSNGSRPSYGVVMRFNGSEIEPTGGSDSQKTKVRPEKTNLFA